MQSYCVRLASDSDCNDLALQADVQAFMRAVSKPRRRIFDWLIDSARRSRTVLVDDEGNQVRLADLSLADFLAWELWVRDYIKPRAPHAERRNRPESLEKRRFLITMLRLSFPREATTWGQHPSVLGMKFTDQKLWIGEDDSFEGRVA